MKTGLKKKVFEEKIRGVVSFDKPLKDYTTFKIGGLALVWIEPDSLEDLRQALILCSQEGIEPFILGGGSNLLVFDGRVNRAVIKLSAPCFKRLAFSDTLVTCGGGYILPLFVVRCIEKGLAGPEKLAGIPGTVGGAVMMNAGNPELNIGEVVKSIDIIDFQGGLRTIEARDCGFRYRGSGLSNCVITGVSFTLKKKDREELRTEFREIYQKKKGSQEYHLPNAGCVFRNPADSKLTSGQMLDQCGLKGKVIGGAAYSTKHANFIVNKGSARFNDVISLIEMGRDSVREKFNVDLEPEIKIIK